MSSSESATKAAIAKTLKKRVYGVLSPFYYLISKLIEEKHALIQGWEIEEIQNDVRNAFLILIPTQPTNDLFERSKTFSEFEYQDRHFTFDEIYKTNHLQHGLTPVHYTERYFSRSSRQYIVVHAYLSIHGQYLYSEVTCRDESDSEKKDNIDIDKSLEVSIKKNMSNGYSVLEKLLEERERRYSDIERESRSSNERLNVLSQSLSHEEDVHAYIEEARKLIEITELLNHYSEKKSRVHLILEDRINEINSWCKPFGGVPDAVVKSYSAIAKPVSSDNSSSQITTFTEKPEAIVRRLLKQLEQLNNSLMIQKTNKGKEPVVSDPKILIERNRVVEAINDVLLKAFSLPRHAFLEEEKKRRGKIVSELMEKIKKHNDQCLSFLTTEFLNGHFSRYRENNDFIELLEAFQFKLGHCFYQEVLEKLIRSENSNEQENLIIACNYLYETFESYRYFIAEMSQNWTGIIPKVEAQKIFSTLNSNLEVSLLYWSYCKGNKNVFQMFLRHGAKVDIWGFRKEGVKKSFFLFYCIGAFEKPGYLDYLELLLNHQVNADLIMTPEMKRANNKIFVENQKEVLKMNRNEKNTKNKTVKDQFYLAQQATKDSALALVVLMVVRNDMTGLNLILPYSSPQNIAFCIGYLATRSGFSAHRFFSNEAPFMDFANHASEAHKRANLVRQHSVELPFLSFIIYPNGGEDKNIVDTEFAQMKFLHKVLRSRIECLANDVEFDRVYRELFKLGMDEILRENWENAFSAFEGCECLLAERCRLLNDQESLELMKKYAIELSEKKIFLIQEMNLGTGWDMVAEHHQSRIAACKKKKHHRSHDIPSILKSSAISLKLSNSSTENMVYCLGLISTSDCFIVGTVMAKTPEILFLKNEAQVNIEVTRIQKSLDKYEKVSPFYSFIICPNPERNNDFHGDINIYIENVKTIQELLRKRIKSIEDNKEFKVLYNRLFKYGCQKISRADIKHAEGAFQACEYLLVERCESLNAEERLALLREYGPGLAQIMMAMYNMKYASAEYDKILRHMTQIFSDKMQAYGVQLNHAELAIVHDARKIAYKDVNIFLRSNNNNKNLVDIVCEQVNYLIDLLDEIHAHHRDKNYDPDKILQLESISTGVSNTITYGYEMAQQIAYNNEVHKPMRAPFLPGLLQKWVQSWEWETWKEKYGKDYPEKVKSGYGSGALIIKK